MPISEAYNCDCLEYMRTLPDKFFDLAIADPPYGININESIGRRHGQKHSGRKDAYWDNTAPDKLFFVELARVSKQQVIWGANHFIENLPTQNASCWLLWDKKISDKVSFSQFEMAWTSLPGMTKKFERVNTLVNEYRFHPTQKPIELYCWILNNYGGGVFKNFRPNDGQPIEPYCRLRYGLRLLGLRTRQRILRKGLRTL